MSDRVPSMRKCQPSSSLTEKEWVVIEPLLPQNKKTRPEKWSNREILDGQNVSTK